MSVYVQIAVGLLPAVFLLAGYLLWARRHWMGVFCALFLILGAGAGCGWMIGHVEDTPGSWKNVRALEDEEEAKEQKELAAVSAYDFACGLAASGETDEAMETLRDTVKERGYEPQAALARARIYGAQGNFKAARALYAKAEREGVLTEEAREEYEAVIQAAESQKTDWLLAAAYPDQEIPQTGSREDGQKAAKLLLERMEDQGNSEAAGAVRQVNQIYEQFLNTGTFDGAELSQAANQLEDLYEEERELFALKPLRDARIKEHVLNQDYEQIAEDITGDSDSSQMMIAMELYLNGYVDEGDFQSRYEEENEEELEAVLDQLRRMERQSGDDVAEEAKDLREEYESYQDADPLEQMEQDLLREAERENGRDSSKIYLQMAKLELNRGEEEKAREYVSRAFDTAGDSDDGDYAAPMQQMIALMGEKEEAEGLKDMALYVQSALDHQLDVPIPAAEEEQAEKFEQYVTDQAVQERIAIHITDLDASAFETVTAEFQFDGGGAEDIRSQILVEDCGVEITDYTLEKINYDSARMLLCCDVSGSMSGQPIEDLKAAVRELGETASGDVSLAVVTFTSSPSVLLGFTRDGEQAVAAAGQMSAGGGTNVYQGVMTSFDQFLSGAGNSMDYIVVLSDGQSADPKSYEEVLAEISAASAAKGISVYTLGLGDGVDANYLEAIANAAGGTYAYVTSSETLASFYQDLETRKDCSYRITYQAVDTLSVNRTLRISDRQEAYRYDERRYYLEGAAGEDQGQASDSLVFGQGVSVEGLDTRFLFRSAGEEQVKLLGSGFREGQPLSLELKGDRSYTLKGEYVDEGTYQVTIPAYPACDTYDLYVRLGGRLAVLEGELTIAAPEDERTVDFGPYRFTSYKRIQGDGFVEMDGYVTMNSWLHFKGQVRLDGDLSGTNVTLTDTKGSYIQYSEESSLGLARLLLKNNEVLSIPALGRLTLYNDNMHQADSDEYRVEYSSLPFLSYGGQVDLTTPGYALYPHKIQVDFVRFSMECEEQDQILKAAKDYNLFNFEIDKAEGILTGDNIGMVLEVKANQGEKREINVSFFKMEAPIKLSGAVRVNTLDNTYGFDFGIELSIFKKNKALKSYGESGDEADGLTFSADWKEKDGEILPDKIHITLKVPLNTTIGTVPVTFDNFTLKVEDIDAENILNTYLEGGVDISVAKITALVPALKDFLDSDLAAVVFADTHLGFSVGKAYMEMGTNAKLFGKVEIGELLFQLGHIPYTNLILGMESEYINGAVFTGTIGPNYEDDTFVIRLQVSTQMALADRVLGLTGTGDCELGFNWWIICPRVKASGDVFIGFYTDHDDRRMFLIRFRDSQNPGKDPLELQKELS